MEEAKATNYEPLTTNQSKEVVHADIFPL